MKSAKKEKRAKIAREERKVGTTVSAATHARMIAQVHRMSQGYVRGTMEGLVRQALDELLERLEERPGAEVDEMTRTTLDWMARSRARARRPLEIEQSLADFAKPGGLSYSVGVDAGSGDRAAVTGLTSEGLIEEIPGGGLMNPAHLAEIADYGASALTEDHQVQGLGYARAIDEQVVLGGENTSAEPEVDEFEWKRRFKREFEQFTRSAPAPLQKRLAKLKLWADRYALMSELREAQKEQA